MSKIRRDGVLGSIKMLGDRKTMLVYKMDVLEQLKGHGYNTTRLRREKLLNESAIQYLRDGKIVGAIALNNICMLLECQPGDLIEYVKE